jgi:methyltransferase (TIGR00027 family)
MKENRASLTAQFIAFFRALETARRPRQARLFVDPLAGAFLGLPLRTLAEIARAPGVGTALRGFIDWRWDGAHSSAAARTRRIDDVVAAALADGAEQVAILGAGFDVRAVRLPGVERRRVFEVDHPATQRVKKQRLVRVLGRLPDHVVFVAADFAKAGFASALAAAGYDPAARTIHLLEGVTMYLSDDANDAIFRWAGSAAAGSRLVFTYTDVGAPFSETEKRKALLALKLLARIGEDFAFGFVPEQLPDYLAQRGLTLVEDIGLAECCDRYLGADRFRWRPDKRTRLAIAEVPKK